MNTLVIGFVGLTHLGLNSAIASAARGFHVLGYSDESELVSELNRGVLPIEEPQLEELLASNTSRLTFSCNPECLSSCAIVYISTDIPTDYSGASDLTPIRHMIKIATENMRADALLVILCQVPPGFTRLIAWPASQLYYQVETLIFGRAVERALHPERFIVGCASSLQPIDIRLLGYLQTFDCPILPMKYESAELAKISINIFLVASVTIANTLAELCEQIGADWSEIVPSLRLDKRIGNYAYLNPGLGISGGNLERDLSTVMTYAQKHKTDASVVAAAMAHSRYCKNWAWRKLNAFVLAQNPHAQICLLGLTYKEDTHSTKNSASLDLLERLNKANVSIFDPRAAVDAGGPNVRRMHTLLDALSGADVVLIMTPWEQFRTITAENLLSRMRGSVVIDPYRMLSRIKLESRGFTYVTLGAPISIKRGH